MHLVDCLDSGAALTPAAPCLTAGDAVLSYAEVQGLSRSVAASLAAYGVRAEDTVGVVAGADPLVASCLLGVARTGASWAVLDPADDGTGVDDDLTRALSASTVLFFRARDAALAAALRARLPRVRRLVCLDRLDPIVRRRLAADSTGRAGSAGSAEVHGWGEFLVAGVGWDGLHPTPPVGVPAAVPGPAEPPVLLALTAPTPRGVSRWAPVLARGGRIVLGAGAPAHAPRWLEA